MPPEGQPKPMLDEDVTSFIAAHAVMQLVGLGNSLRPSILIGIEKALEAGLPVVGENELVPTEDGYLRDGVPKEALVEQFSRLLQDRAYLESLNRLRPEILLPGFKKDVGWFIQGERMGRPDS